MSTPNAVVVDANILISICSKEQNTYPIADSVFSAYARHGWEFYAPNVVVAEVLFAMCVKCQSGALTQSEYGQAIDIFTDCMQFVGTPDDESSLIKRAAEIRSGYTCKRTSDAFYIAFAEELSRTRISEIVTFDKGLKPQIAKYAPTVTLNLLTCPADHP